jgi:hypothetical protein
MKKKNGPKNKKQKLTPLIRLAINAKKAPELDDDRWDEILHDMEESSGVFPLANDEEVV